MPFAKLFSLEEAQSLLPSLQSQLTELVELKRFLDRAGYDVHRHQYFGGMGPNGQKVFPPQMERLVEIVTGMNEQGIEIKDLDKGLIDFPHRRASGEIVYLCYLLGEPQIRAWHTIEGGFAGRQPIEHL